MPHDALVAVAPGLTHDHPRDPVHSNSAPEGYTQASDWPVRPGLS
jgi:hypothetical protein